MKLDGLQDGDRTPEEQLMAIWPAIKIAEGKTVADLGAAEGIIALEFAKAGATRVLAIDADVGHLAVAQKLCKKFPAVKIKHFDLNRADGGDPLEYDFVLCLGIIHKLIYPGKGLLFAARSAKELLLLRSGRGSVNGIIRSKHHGYNMCDSALLLRGEGFELEKVVDGPAHRAEPTEYWRRVA